MSFTAEEVSSKIGVSTIKIDSRTLETVNEISTKYPPKIFNLDMLDAKWKTFTFRNKIKNMNNITPSHLIKFFKQIDDQCKQQQISMIIDDDNNLDKPFLSSKKEEMGDKRSLETLTATEENDLKRIKTEDEHADMNQYQGKFVKEEEDVNQIKKDKISFNPMFKNKMKENVKTSDSLSDETKVLKELTYNISSPKYNDNIKIVSDSNTNGSFKIFRESTTTLSKFLDTQLSTKESLYEKYEIADPTVQSQSAIYSIGRIVNDSVTELEPIFEKSNLALETSRKVGIGRRIKIDIGNLTEGDLFLGQVILCKGRNVTGEEFIIDEIIKAENSSTKDEEMDVEDTKDFKICSINGPLCADSSLDHTVFSKFIEKLNTSIQPDYLIINGPLLDITNKCISSGIIPPIITKLADGSEIIENVETLEDIFQKLIKPLLAKISQTTKILLVPHATDTISKYTSYPQPSYNAKIFEDMRNVYLLPNPGFVEINGLKIMINNIDIFKNIKTVDLQSTTRKNKFKLVTELMIENESAYPLYPTIPSVNEKTSSNKRFNDMFDIPENHDFGKGNIAWMLGSSKQRINKNINSQIQTNLPETFKDGVDMVIHNSGFVPHLETISEQGCTINTNGFYNGDKLGFYSEISVSKQNADVKIIKL